MSWAENINGPWEEFNLGGRYNNRTRRGVFDVRSDPSRSSYGHLAAPDVIVDDQNRQFIMFFHARNQPSTTTNSGKPVQRLHQGFVATSADGLNFFDPKTAGGQPGHGPKTVTADGVTRDIWIGRPYQRAFRHQGFWYSVAKRGIINRARSATRPWELNPDNPFGMAWLMEDTPSALWTNDASKVQNNYNSPAATFLATSEFASHPNNPHPGVRIDCNSERINHLSVCKLPHDQLELFFYVRLDPDDRYDALYRVVYDISNPDFQKWNLVRDETGLTLFEVVVTPEEISAAVLAAKPDAKPLFYADPVSLGSTGVCIDRDGSKYLFYAYESRRYSGRDTEGQISAIRLIPR